MAGEKLREREFRFRCKIQKVRKGYVDHKGVERADEVVVLVPDDSTEMYLFMKGWLPSFEEEAYEVGISLAHPDIGLCRAAIRLKNADCDKHHLFVMTTSVEELLKDRDGQWAEIIVFKESEMEEYLHSEGL